MDSRAAAAEAMRSAIEYWSQFVARCISQRLDTEKFENYVRLVHDQHPLPPALVADFFLRPQPSNDNSLDPRIPPYLQVLTRLGYVDAPSILKALYKYSSLHAYAQQPNANDGKETEKETEQSDDKEKDEQKQQVTRWKSSYWAEEVLFYGITKSVVEGKAIRDSKTALDMTRIISKLMVLFTTAFAADMLEQLHTAQVRDEMESSRAALVALLLRMCENDILVGALVPQITDKLEQFRTEILASSDPADKKKQATNAAMDELLDSAVGLDNFVVAEIPVSNTRAGLYIYLNAAKHSKDKLVQDCLSDTEKIQGLVRELDKMDGNVGAVCQALVESLDVILLFEKLPNILEPLCQLLDNWRYEDDQEEYQPVYEEFGAVLLLVLAFTYRYNLNAVDIGIASPDSWVAKIIGRGHIGRQYLVDTFLLPSLVPAIRFLADYLWIDQKEQKSIIKILQLILLPSSISGEASTMLSSVKNLIAKPLEHALRTYQRRDPKNQDIEPLLRTLKDSIPLSRRTGGTDLNELESWTVTPPTGLSSAIKLTIQGLVHWSIHPAMNSMPTSYTHRQILAALKIMGPKRVLHVILEEIRQHTEAGSASIVYDVAISLICAPDAAKDAPAVVDANGNMLPPVQRQRSLRDLLKVEAEGCRKLQKKDPALAEIVVRLHRRVEAQMIIPQPPGILQTAEMSLNLDGDTAALGDAMAAAASGVQGDNMSVDNLTLDVSMGGVPSDLGLGSANDGGSLDPSGDAAMFEGFDTQDMDNFDWDDIGNSF
uniref:Mediator of RNA polymerase II transcription subunit 5 n=1 Tax=Fusarium oxysporum (strain Fo5176) TaxID=660025 RepID=A0A0D2XC79_FUSOF